MPNHTTPFSTPESSSHNDFGHSHTTGLSGTQQTFPNGRVVIDATETLTAFRTDGLNGTLTASCKRTKTGHVTVVEQNNYSYKGRVLPASTLFEAINDFPNDTPGGFQPTQDKNVIASQFGKNDHEDEGTGSPKMGLIQTNSEVFGASLKVSIMKSLFGEHWDHNDKRLSALIEVFHPQTQRVVRVPLVDIGPGENIPAEVDLTWACDQFLGTQGQAHVRYRVLMPV